MEIGDDDDESSSTGWSVATKIASDFQITAGSGVLVELWAVAPLSMDEEDEMDGRRTDVAGWKAKLISSNYWMNNQFFRGRLTDETA
jgi:hypothetical protein